MSWLLKTAPLLVPLLGVLVAYLINSTLIMAPNKENLTHDVSTLHEEIIRELDVLRGKKVSEQDGLKVFTAFRHKWAPDMAKVGVRLEHSKEVRHIAPLDTIEEYASTDPLFRSMTEELTGVFDFEEFKNPPSTFEAEQTFEFMGQYVAEMEGIITKLNYLLPEWSALGMYYELDIIPSMTAFIEGISKYIKSMETLVPSKDAKNILKIENILEYVQKIFNKLTDWVKQSEQEYDKLKLSESLLSDSQEAFREIHNLRFTRSLFIIHFSLRLKVTDPDKHPVGEEIEFNVKVLEKLGGLYDQVTEATKAFKVSQDQGTKSELKKQITQFHFDIAEEVNESRAEMKKFFAFLTYQMKVTGVIQEAVMEKGKQAKELRKTVLEMNKDMIRLRSEFKEVCDQIQGIRQKEDKTGRMESDFDDNNDLIFDTQYEL